MKRTTSAVVSSATLLVLLLHLSTSSSSAATTEILATLAPTNTTPAPSTAAPWGKLAPGCTAASATTAAASPSYAACGKDSTFTFDLSLAKSLSENAFCRSTACLALYRVLKSGASNALFCANVPGLDNVRLDTRAGPAACFGREAADGNSDTIVRPGDSEANSGSDDDGPKPTTSPPKPTTPAPTTTAPPTLAPEPSTLRPVKPTTTPTPTTKKPRPADGSGSHSAVITVPTSPPLDGSGNNQSSGDNSNGMETGTIIAIVAVSIGVVAVLIALIYVIRRKPKRKTSHQNRSTYSRETVSHEQLTSYYGDHNVRPSVSQSYAAVPNGVGMGMGMGPHGEGRPSVLWHSGTANIGTAFAGWDEELITAVRIPYEKLTFDELMSRGGYGEVYRGTYRGELVAIKTLLPERRRDMQQIQSFLAEVKIMANMEHERIVHFIGVAWDSLEELSVVSEFLERGDLRTVLAGFEKDPHRPHGFDVTKIQIALHVAHGLTYMHTLQPIVLHRDLKSRNILLDAHLNAKITDFGVSRERSDRTMTAGVGSSLWMAPEVMMGERYDEKADIFSFGIVLSELDNHVLPYSHAIDRATGRRMPDAVVLQMVSLGRMRATFTDEVQSDMAQIGIQCISVNPSDRPTAAEVLHLVHQVWRRYNSA